MRIRLLSVALAVLAAVSTSAAVAETMTSLKSFEGIEEPAVRFIPATAKFEPDSFVNITDVGTGIVRMTLRYHAQQWWDGDRTTRSRDRQRAEVKGLGVHQKEGETFEYRTTFRTDPTFVGSNRFCHVYQLKATDGDNGAPLIVLSLHKDGEGSLRYCSGTSRGFTVARNFHWKPDTWHTAIIRVKTSSKNEGEVLGSIDGDSLDGSKDIAVFRPRATDYRPKWGLYRGVDGNTPYGENFVEHKDVAASKL